MSTPYEQWKKVDVRTWMHASKNFIVVEYFEGDGWYIVTRAAGALSERYDSADAAMEVVEGIIEMEKKTKP